RQGFQALFSTASAIAAVFGLTGFVVAVVCGLWTAAPAHEALTRALIGMAGCYAIGLFAGRVGEHVASEYVVSYARSRPIPARSSDLDPHGGGAGAAPTLAGGTDASEENSVVVG
ncbi:MAG TPA: hypothetical protein PKU91_06140, partial [Phycisphaerales bacterium]|nr:hypothetical protein [Phycisphaerales bacterium]